MKMEILVMPQNRLVSATIQCIVYIILNIFKFFNIFIGNRVDCQLCRQPLQGEPN